MAHYRVPVSFIAEFVSAVVTGRSLDFSREARFLATGISPAIEILGRDHIPETGPCVITPNHFARPGFRAWWIAIGISANVPVNVHWFMTSNWTSHHFWQKGWYEQVTCWLFERIARVFSFGQLSSIDSDEIGGNRLPQVRALMSSAVENVHSQNSRDAVLGLAPEGGDMPGGALGWPPKGSGKLFQFFSNLGYGINPVGVYESNNRFVINFGEQYRLSTNREFSAVTRDIQIRRIVMSHIAMCLPDHLKGEFR